jgi:hypothetical protein
MFRLADQIIDSHMARALQMDASRGHPVLAWIVMWDDPIYPDRYIARLTTAAPLPYVLIGNSLAEVQEQLPPGLCWRARQRVDPPEVIEVWVPG